MQTSKNSFIKAILSIYTLTSLMACNLPSPKDKDSGNEAATFTAQAMADRSKALETSVQGAFALPASKVFNLQACVKDVAYDKIIAGHEFIVDEIDRRVVSDKAGCITWHERIAYNFLGESQYIRIERHIKGMGLHKGTQKVAFAINPWSHGENLSPVLNPDDGNAIPRLVDDKVEGQAALKGFSSDSQITTRPLWVEDGRLFITEQKLTSKGVDVQVEIRPNVSIQLTKMNGELFLRPLSAGTFKARLKLIHSYYQDNEEIHRLLSETDLNNVKMENSSLAIRTTMSLSAIPTRGQIVLGLELQPLEAPQGLTPFEGIYLLGEYDQIKGTSFLKLNTLVSETKEFKLSKYINSTLTDIQSSTKTTSLESDSYQKPKIEVNQLEFRFIRVGEDRTATREIFYNIKACIRHGLDQKNTRAHTFQITKFRQNESDEASSFSVKTDNNSCINWDESVTFKYFDCQHYLKGFVQIENKDLGMNEKLEILVNPWDSQGMAARDLRYVNKSEKITLSCAQENRPSTQVMLDGFSYATLSYDYGIDSFLNLTVSKKIQLRMEPRILMYSSLTNGLSESERLRDGVYLLKVAIVKNRNYEDRNNNTYVSSADTFVNVLNGQINTEVTFKTHDLKALGNRNNILVELYPIDQSKVTVSQGRIYLKNPSALMDSAIDFSTGIETPTFIGPITLNIDESYRPLRMADPTAISKFFLDGQGQNKSNQKFLIQRIVTDGKKILLEKQKEIKTRSEKLQYAKENNLDVVSLKNADTQAPLMKALTGSTRLNSKLTITKSELQNLVEKGTLYTLTATKLCAFWNHDYFAKLYADKGGATKSNFTADCYSAVAKDPTSFFQVQKQLLIKEVGGSQFLKGLNQGLSVGTSFSLSASHTTSKTRSTSLSVKAGLSKKFLDIISLGADIGYTLSWATADANSSSNSISVNSATTMTVQQNIFKIRLNKYEQCAIVRLNPLLFIKDKSWFGRTDYLDNLNPRLNAEEKATAVTRGIMICEGQIRNQPLDVREDYFLIAQETSSSQMQDNGDARNRNFFIALRSKNDFQRFVVAMKGETSMPVSAEKDEDVQNQATEMMTKLFQLADPSYPGVYWNH